MEIISSEFTNFLQRKRLRIFRAGISDPKSEFAPGHWKTGVHKILKEMRKIPLAFFIVLGYDMLALKGKEC